MLILKIIENNTMSNVQELHLDLFSSPTKAILASHFLDSFSTFFN